MRFRRGVIFFVWAPVLLACVTCNSDDDQIVENERKAILALKDIFRAQVDFKENDLDKNGVKDYWTADISGLYRTLIGGKEIKLIGPDIAIADAAPMSDGKDLGPMLSPRPIAKNGYYFRALKSYEDPAGSINPYGSKNTLRFGFVAYPETYNGTGRQTFIIWEGGTVWRKVLAGEMVNENAAGWFSGWGRPE